MLTAVLALVFSSFTLPGDPAKDITGKWKIDESSIDGVAKAIINATQKTNPERVQQLEEHMDMLNQLIAGMEFEYHADSTYVIQTPQGPQAGKWYFDAAGQHLTITRNGKPDRSDVVLEISSTRLKLVNTERGDTTLFIRP